MENILKNICNTIVTEEDCAKQIIQDALGVSCDEELNDIWKTLLVDSPKKIEEKVISSENTEKKESNVQLSENKEGKMILLEKVHLQRVVKKRQTFHTMNLCLPYNCSVMKRYQLRMMMMMINKSIMVCITLFF